MSTPDPDRPAPDDVPPTPVEDTIDPTNVVDEALYETFPASDAPGYTKGVVSASDYESRDDEDGDS